MFEQRLKYERQINMWYIFVSIQSHLSTLHFLWYDETIMTFPRTAFLVGKVCREVFLTNDDLFG
jgi:hypothetical protein